MASVRLKPVDDRILVEPIEPETRTPSGIVLPDAAKEQPQMGKVVEVGTDEEVQKLVRPGDVVVFAKFSGTVVKVDGRELRILSRSEILATAEL
ncbi:MAG: co-chaperone GroES [Firmicutes bacterium]|nr:co-chaperone GroES [Bacillota bacterium]